jgi:hypothetical protein
LASSGFFGSEALNGWGAVNDGDKKNNPGKHWHTKLSFRRGLGLYRLIFVR